MFVDAANKSRHGEEPRSGVSNHARSRVKTQLTMLRFNGSVNRIGGACASLPPWHSGFSRARFSAFGIAWRVCRHPDDDGKP
jgi:hypothetical protein